MQLAAPELWGQLVQLDQEMVLQVRLVQLAQLVLVLVKLAQLVQPDQLAQLV